MIRWFAKNDYAANFLLVAILLAGLYAAWFKIPTEVSPSYRLPFVQVTIPLPGGTPTEVEQKILIPVENVLKGLGEIDSITAEARRGRGQFTIYTKDGVDRDKLRTEIESRIGSINTFPREAEPPRVRIPDTANWKEVISVVVSGDLPEKELLTAARQIRDDLTALPGISKATVIGARTREIGIEIDPETLKDYGLTLASVAQVIKQNSLDLSAGSIHTESSRILLRSTNQALTRDQFNKLIITRSNGATVKLGDIATVKDAFDEQRKLTRFNGQRCAIVEVTRLSDENALKISDQVHAYVESASNKFPEGIHISTWDDDSVSLRGRISILFWNLLQGCVLVFILLTLFLRLSLAFWVIIGIPVSFAGALILMPSLGITANIMSLFGFIVVLGILVDDAIVTGEHIFSKLKLGMPPLEAAVTGTREIAVPVTFGVLTTVVAFIPLAFLTGFIGTYARQIPYVVIPVLLFSWIESKLILPSHLKHISVNRTSKGFLTRVQQAISRKLDFFIYRVYEPLLHLCVRWRYITLSIFLAIGIATIGIMTSGIMGFQSFPSVDRYFIFAKLKMNDGTTFDQTDANVLKISHAAEQLKQQFTDGPGGPSLIGNIMTSTGGWPSWGGQNDARGFVLVEIIPPEERQFPGPKNQEIAEAWRNLVGKIPGARSFSIQTERSGGGYMGDREDVEIELRGHDDKTMVAVAEKIEAALKKIPGVFNAYSDIDAPQKEYLISLLPYGRELGLTQENLARQVRSAFFGIEAQRIQIGEDNVKVMVRFPKEQRESLHTLETLQITLPNRGNTSNSTAKQAINNKRGESPPSISLQAIAKVTLNETPPSIVRRDGARTYTISATPENKEVSIASIGEAITPKLDDLTHATPGTSWRFAGFLAEDAANKHRFWVLAGLLLFTLYTLLAIPFKSLTQPIFVLLAIPFGAVGAILGHIFLGITPSYLSLFGILALAGVVVNDSLVMVDFTNQKRRQGASTYEAVIHSGSARFRPILLTSLTTFAGLMPLIFERSIQAQFLIPMAVSLAFGILFATVITLFLIPCAYIATEDMKHLFKKALRWYVKPFKKCDHS